MTKLNIFGGPRYKEQQENRLTWALMTLLRLVPLACTAFVDLVRTRQSEQQVMEPIPALTAMHGCDTHIETQVESLAGHAGRLVAVGITSEGGSVQVPIEARDRDARYDGVMTFQPSKQDSQTQDGHEPVMLTVEAKLGPYVGPWQLMPSAHHLPVPEDEEGTSPIRVDQRAVVLAWRDIFRTLTDLDARNLLAPSEALLVNDFLEYVRRKHPGLNPFDRFALCRGSISLLNRRCEKIMREIQPEEAWHRSSPIIAVESGSFRQIWLHAERSDEIRLGIYPGDTMRQAREFWPRVNAAKLRALAASAHWNIRPNLHFSKYQLHFYWAKSHMTVAEYINYWKNCDPWQEIRSCWPDSAGSFRHEYEQLARRGLISPDDVEPLDQQTTPTNYPRISMSPGLAIEYAWRRSDADRLDAHGEFVGEVRQRIREATETWGEIPPFCERARAEPDADDA